MANQINVRRVRPLTANGHQTWGSKARDRIDSTLLIQRLQRVALGQEEATQTEINAARILLAKCLPDIAPMKQEEKMGTSAKTITNDQLFNLIEGQVVRVDDE